MGTEGILFAVAVMGAVGALVSRRGAAEAPSVVPERSDINMFSDYGDESLPSEYYSAMAAVERAVKEQKGTTVNAAPILSRRAAARQPTAGPTQATFGRRITH